MTTDHTLLHTTLRHCSTLALGLIAALAGASAAADEALDEVSTFDIAPQPLADALLEFSQQANIQIVMVSATVKDIEAGGIVGERTNREALELLLDDQALRYTQHDDRTVSIQTNAVIEGLAWGKFQPTLSSALLAQAQTSAPQKQETHNSRTSGNTGEATQSIPIDEIIVTGTNIRGIAPESSPVRTFDRDDILNSGAATAQDFIQTLPLNFGGGSNANTGGGLPNDESTSFNSGSLGSLGSSVNLRGLGSGSTLVLLNGRRLAPSSGIGDFVDISLVPASAIERVEVLSDGASAIYGADAVAGVVNFVLRDDYDGVEASFRYGTVTDGDFDAYRASFSAGKNWNGGNALVVYEYFNQGDLSAGDREFSQDAALPNDLLPSQERHSVLGSIKQELSLDLEVFGDFIYSAREAEQDVFFIFAPEPSRTTPSTENLSISVGGAWKASETWFADFSSTFSDVYSEPAQLGVDTLRFETDSRIWTADAKASGDLFDLPGGDVKLALGGHVRTESFKNVIVESPTSAPGTVNADIDRDIYAFFGEAFIPLIGAENAVPSIERLELNVSGRFERYSDFGSTVDPKVGILWSPVEQLDLRGSYSTSFNPPPLGRVGATDLIASVFPTAVINDAFGLTPGDPSIANVVTLVLAGTDKNLDPEESRAFTGGLDYNEKWGRHSFDFSTTYFDIDFENRLGITPVPGNANFFDAPNIAFKNPKLFPDEAVVFSPPVDEIIQVLDSLDTPVALFPGVDPLDTQIINRVNVVRNLARTVVKGIDFDVTYVYEAGVGDFTLGLDGTYLIDFQQQGASTTPLVEQIDTLFNPVGLKFRTRAGYARDGLAANIFVNYIDDYQVDNSAGAAKIDSCATVDLSLSYNSGNKTNGGVLNDATFRLAMSNLFDENPPSVPSNPQFFIFGYDPANANPRNRFIAFEVTKAF